MYKLVIGRFGSRGMDEKVDVSTVEEALEKALGVAAALKDAAKRDHRDIHVAARSGKAGQAVAVAMLSDVHAEETVNPATVNAHRF